MTLLLCAIALAEPRFALREGVPCGACHVNESGGGMRTPYGVAFAETVLASHTLPGAFLPSLGENVAIGANLRLKSHTLLPTHTELDELSWDTEASTSFEIPEGNLYLRLDAIRDRLLLYIDETVAPEGAAAREAFVMLRAPWGGWLKAGRFMLPYGLRLQDDAAFVREATGFTYANQDLGVELGWSGRPLTAMVAISNGSGGGADPDLFKQVTASVINTGPWWRAGASFAFNDNSTDDTRYQTFTSGVHAGLRLGRLIGTGEVDWIHGVSGEDSFDQLPFYVGADFEATRGVWARFVFEAFDPLLDLDENERDRFVIGASWFPIQMLELRGEYRVDRDIPQRIEGNVDEIRVELHGFL